MSCTLHFICTCALHYIVTITTIPCRWHLAVHCIPPWYKTLQIASTINDLERVFCQSWKKVSTLLQHAFVNSLDLATDVDTDRSPVKPLSRFILAHQFAAGCAPLSSLKHVDLELLRHFGPKHCSSEALVPDSREWYLTHPKQVAMIFEIKKNFYWDPIDVIRVRWKNRQGWSRWYTCLFATESSWSRRQQNNMARIGVVTSEVLSESSCLWVAQCQNHFNSHIPFVRGYTFGMQQLVTARGMHTSSIRSLVDARWSMARYYLQGQNQVLDL